MEKVPEKICGCEKALWNGESGFKASRIIGGYEEALKRIMGKLWGRFREGFEEGSRNGESGCEASKIMGSREGAPEKFLGRM